MRLYRGLKTRYQPEKVGKTAPYFGTDFTTCPYTALRYASTPRGVVLVLDVPATNELRVSEELWADTKAKRLMAWGRFDSFVARIIPAKELRAQIRKKGVAGQGQAYKVGVLEQYIDRLLRDVHLPATEAPAGSRRANRARRGFQCRRAQLSTSTVTHGRQVVPWLAADGPLAYTPEKPPDRDYYFQYGWVLPGIFAEHINKRCHYYFGAGRREFARKAFSFWQAARDGSVQRVVHSLGTLNAEVVTAPVAVYRTERDWRGLAYVLIQHGSYQIVPIADQPLLETGEVVLYRGVQKSWQFRLLSVAESDTAGRDAWRCYLRVQAHVLSDATRSFNSIHDRTKRCETVHIRDRSWMTDDIARQYGLDIDGTGFPRLLWEAAHQSFALVRCVAEGKFGPHYVVAKTPLGNIRLTTFFAGEYEVRIIDPSRVELLEEHGCQVQRHGY